MVERSGRNSFVTVFLRGEPSSKHLDGVDGILVELGQNGDSGHPLELSEFRYDEFPVFFIHIKRAIP